jgi:hypothetical protein
VNFEPAQNDALGQRRGKDDNAGGEQLPALHPTSDLVHGELEVDG